MGIKSYLREQQQKRKESRAFKRIVEKKALQERRKAYAAESIVAAREEGKMKARRPSFVKRTADAAVKRVTAPPRRKPITKKYVKTVYKRAQPKRRKSSRRVVYREAPRQEARPFNIGDII